MSNETHASHDHHSTIDSPDTRASATVRLESHHLELANEIRDYTGEQNVSIEKVLHFALGKTVDQLKDGDASDGYRAAMYGRPAEASGIDWGDLD